MAASVRAQVMQRSKVSHTTSSPWCANWTSQRTQTLPARQRNCLSEHSNMLTHPSGCCWIRPASAVTGMIRLKVGRSLAWHKHGWPLPALRPSVIARATSEGCEVVSEPQTDEALLKRLTRQLEGDLETLYDPTLTPDERQVSLQRLQLTSKRMVVVQKRIVAAQEQRNWFLERKVRQLEIQERQGGSTHQGVVWDAQLDEQLAQVLFQPFPPNTLPTLLEPDRLRQLLKTPATVHISDFDRTFTPGFPVLASVFQGTSPSKAPRTISFAEARSRSGLFNQLAVICNLPATDNGSDANCRVWWHMQIKIVLNMASQMAGLPVAHGISVPDISVAQQPSQPVVRHLVVWVSNVILLAGYIYGDQQPLPEKETIDTHVSAPPVWYGRLGWVLYLAAAGSNVQLFAAHSDRQGELYPVTAELDITRNQDYSDFILALINVFRMANTIHQEKWLPSYLQRGEMRLLGYTDRPSPYREPSCMFARWYQQQKVRVTLTRHHVHKQYYAPGYALNDIMPVYEAIRTGLIPNTVKVLDIKVLNADGESPETYSDNQWYDVRIQMSQPANHQIPANCQELYEMVLAVLEALQALHSLGYVHRDIWFGNVLRDESRWILIDWELAGQAGQVVPYDIRRLPKGVMDGVELYTASTDMWQVAEMIKEMVRQYYNIRYCAAAEEFANDIINQSLTAEKALQMLRRDKRCAR